MATENIYYLLRVGKDKTVREMAEELYISPAYVNAIEKGTRVPSKRLRRAYAQFFGVDEEFLDKAENKINSKGWGFEKIMLYLLKQIVDLSEDDM